MPFQNGPFRFFPTLSAQQIILAMQIDGPPPSAFTTAGFNHGEPAPSSQSAQRQRRTQTRQAATPVLAGGKKPYHKHPRRVSVFERYDQSQDSSLGQLNDAAHLAQTIRAVADTSGLHECALEENKTKYTTGKDQQNLYLI